MFKKYEESNEFPNIDIEITKFDNDFFTLFQLHQFNIEHKTSTYRRIKQIDINQHVKDLAQYNQVDVRDSFDQDEDDEVKKLEEEKQKKSSRVNKSIPLDEFLLYLVFSKTTNAKVR